jgi:hypothetical protein
MSSSASAAENPKALASFTNAAPLGAPKSILTPYYDAKPWRLAFSEEALLPSIERSPVDLTALAQLAINFKALICT